MIEILRQLDKQLFLFINYLPHNLFSDLIFGFLTFVSSYGFIWFLIAGLVIFAKSKDKKGLVTILAGALLSITAEVVLKNLIRRPRPQFVLPETFVPFDFTHSYSFPSGHAIMAFAMAFILSKIDSKAGWAYYLLAILISFSRIYLGKHYPSDILGGVVLGLLIGAVSLGVVSRFRLTLN